MTVFRDVADVAGIEPTVLQHFRRRFRLAIVTSHHVWTTNENLAVFRNLELDAVKRNSHRADVIITGTVCRNDARLGRAITLQNRYSGREICVRQRWRE